MSKPKSPPKNDRDKVLTHRYQIIASIVGITVILAFIIELPPKISATIDVFRATDTPTLTNTPEPSATLTPAPTNTDLPTVTLESTSTVTSMPTPNITSNILLQDDFIDNRNGWLLQNEQSMKSDIIGGKYKFTITCPQSHGGFYCGNYIKVPGLSSKDFQLELDVAMKNISPAAEVMIAFQFRVNASNYYTVYFRSIGKYTVNRSYNGSLGKLLEDTTIPGFSPNTDTVNRYGFFARDIFLKPLFNGQELLSVEDGFINHAGSVYIAIFVSRSGSAIVEMDNFIATDTSK